MHVITANVFNYLVYMQKAIISYKCLILVVKAYNHYLESFYISISAKYFCTNVFYIKNMFYIC